ncbi:MAG: hypothetical protein K2Z81_08185, partial [Cyanobacteria bacterium]|nr:hypothetical protein [Cyanobacteriota bacterium]
MKTASLVLITASSFCLALGAFAKDTVMLPNQQNQNCANRGGVKAVPQANAQQQRTDVANSAVPKVEGKIPSSSSK